MTATNNAWAEDTGLHPVVPAAEKKPARSTKREGSGHGARTVSRMIRVSYLSSPLALLLPVAVGLIVAGLGGISMVTNGVDYGVVARPLERSGATLLLMGVLFAVLMFFTVSRGASAIMSLGVSRSAYWNGVVLTTLITALKQGAIISVLVVVEVLTYGWGILWGIFSSPFLIPAMRDSYGWATGLPLLASGLLNWVFWIFLVQLMGALLGALTHRFGTSLKGVLILALTVVACWYFVTAILFLFPSMGISDMMRIYPVSWDANGKPEYLRYIRFEPGFWPGQATMPYLGFIPFTVGQHLLGVVLAYLAGLLVWRRTSLR